MIGLISGTGMESLFDVAEPADPGETGWGEPSSPIFRVHLAGSGPDLLLLMRHGVRGDIPPHRVNYRANIAAMKQAGASHLVAINTAGAITRVDRVGGLCIPHQLIDLTWGRDCTYHDGGESGRRHMDFTSPFDQEWRDLLMQRVAELPVALQERGVYACTQGPRLETAAEVEYLRRIGADLVGMTLMPEAALARELGLPYASICPLVNAAAGIESGVISMQQVDANAKALQPVIAQLIRKLVQSL